ncbi:MAG: beta-N-acetylhexosaminidase [Candidatus Eremiobacteraeota bacterium]|nr:beta-N-acetylhexosaminidase [Candidatus Eremiobacteraeota bacterium]
MPRALADEIGGLFMFGFEGTRADQLPADLIAQSAGVILFRRNIESAAQLRALTDAIRALGQPDGPAQLVAIDQEGGPVSRLAGIGTTTPSAMALGAVNEPSTTESMYRIIGDELAAVGVNLNFAPVADVNNNPDNPVVGIRSFGDDPAAVSVSVQAAIRGLRSAGIAATAKHFPGHGDTTVDSHFGLPLIPHDISRVRALELVPFAGAIGERVDVIMTAHVVFPAVEPQRVPATLSPRILTGLLRNELGFEGVICTDCMEMQAIADRYTPQEAALSALAAGADMVLFSHSIDRVRAGVAAVRAAVIDGTLPEQHVRRSLERIRALRAHLHATRKECSLDVVGSAPHQSAALDAARRAMSVVRDPSGLLPLSLGAGAKMLVVQFSGGAVSAVEDSTGTVAKGRYVTPIAQALAEGPVRVHEQVRSLEPAGHEYKQLLMASQTADAVVVVTSRAKQHASQARAVADLAMLGKHVIVVAGREPYDADVLPSEVTVIASYGEDDHAMRAAAEVVLGIAVPRGKLPVRLGAATSSAP